MVNISPAHTSLRTRFLLAALLPALATIVAWSPQVLFRSTTEPASPLLLVLLLVSAPIVALLVNRRWPAATNAARSIGVALPQLVVLPMVWLDVWLDVQNGNLLRGSGEEAMSYGLGTLAGLVAGVILVVLVAFTSRLGARLGTH
jgi:hypothetical protein